MSVLIVARKGGDSSNSLDVALNSTGYVQITLVDLQSGRSETISCNGECHYTFPSISKRADSLAITTEFGDTVSAFIVMTIFTSSD